MEREREGEKKNQSLNHLSISGFALPCITTTRPLLSDSEPSTECSTTKQDTCPMTRRSRSTSTPKRSNLAVARAPSLHGHIGAVVSHGKKHLLGKSSKI